MNVKVYQKKGLLRHLGLLFIAVLLAGNVWAGQADITVTGRVTSEGGSEGLPGVNVLLKGTNSGTITGINGEYSIVVPDRDAILIFSYVGYNSTEEAVNGRILINVSLTPSVGNLSEVVVTALGIQREQKSLGYSVGKVEGASITKVAQENVLNGMAGNTKQIR